MTKRIGSLTLAAAAALGSAALGAQTPAPSRLAPPARAKPTLAPPPSAFLEGQVKGPDGKPVEQALVVARAATASFSDPPRTARTSPEGRFRIEVKARGPHTVRVEARGLAARTVEKVVPGAAPLAIALAKGGFIEGVVKDGATGQTVPAARVEAREVAGAIGAPWEAGAGLVDATSDDKGRFRLEGLARGRHTVTGSARGFGRATRGNVALGQRVELFLTAGASIAGTVRDPAGRPVEGAVVRVEPENRGLSMPPASRTGRDGRYDAFGLGVGFHRVLVHHPEFAPAIAAGISVETGNETAADVTLERGVPVVGRMVDPAREPASGQIVLADLDGASARSFWSVVRADAGPDGRFQLARLPVGSHVLSATAPGFVTRRVEVEVRRADAKVDVGDVTMEAGHAIRGRVKNSSAAPIPGARVIGFPSRGGMGMAGLSGPLEANTDAEGRFVVAAPTPGAYRLQVEAPGHAPGQQVADTGGPDVQIVLTAAGTITGSVVDERGRPLEGVFASAEAARAEGEMRVVMSPNRRPASSEDGRFVLENLAAATYVVTVSAPDRVRKVVSDVQVAAGASVDLGTLRMHPGAALRGTVVDGTGTAVPGAVVQTQGASEAVYFFEDDPAATTDAAGAFELRGTTPGTVEVYARHPMHSEGRASAAIDPVKGAEVRIVMGDGGRVAGLARRRDGPIAGAMVSLQPVGGGSSGWNPALQTSTGPDGTFTVEHVPPGRNRVALLERSGGERFTSSQMKEVEIVEGETVRVEFAPRDIVMAGRVTQGGVPVPNLRILVSMNDASGGMMVSYGGGAPGAATIGPQRMTAVTGEDGRYEMLVDHVGKGSARFESLDRRGSYPAQTFEVPDAESHTRDFDLPTATLTGTVVDGDTQQPVARASVTAASREPTPKRGGTAETGPDGRFTVSVEPGDYRLTARAEGYAMRSVEASAGSSAADLTIALERGVPIAGRVLDARGTSVAGASVIASVPEKDDLRGMDSADTLADGSFRLEGVTAGAYNLTASTENGGWAILPGVRAGTSNVLLRLGPWARVRVRVVDADGRPVARAFVGVEHVNGQTVAFWNAGGMTTAGGTAEMRVPAGAVELRARRETLSGTVQAAATEGQATEVEITVTETRPAGSP